MFFICNCIFECLHIDLYSTLYNFGVKVGVNFEGF